MKILINDQIKAADKVTIEHEPVESINLMERAAELVSQWICNNVEQGTPLLFFIGKGNNGGDGLAVARMLSSVGYGCTAFMVYDQKELSEDCRYNLKRLPSNVILVNDASRLELYEHTVVIDALLGTGLKGELHEPIISVVSLLNSLSNRIISIDMPSGMKSEFGNDPSMIVAAEATLTLEQPKLAMLLPEAGECCGKIEVLPIDLDAEYILNAESPFFYTTEDVVKGLIAPRRKFAHKGNYGHALLVCGSEGMMGAAILTTSAALRSGCGLVTTHTPINERFAIQASCPSALLSGDRGVCFSQLPTDIEKYNAVGVGCGMGRADETKLAFIQLLKSYRSKSMVYDADALNIVAEHPELMSLIAHNSVLTPHVGELRRLIGEWTDEEHKIELTRELAISLQSVVVLKGAHTMICMPDGSCHFNSSGCSGMAKGGSGDVLTGFITGLLARGYSAVDASLIGVYIHGKAGEKAAEYYGSESMNSSDLIDFLAEALSEL